jgi:hypothetical protein
MPTPQEKYYDGMNTLLAPVRWAKGFVQFLLIIAGVILFGLGLPFYCLFTGTHMEPWMLWTTALVVTGLASFVLSPWYTAITFLWAPLLLCFLWKGAYESFDWFHIEYQGAGSVPVACLIIFAIGIVKGIPKFAKNVYVKITLYRFGRRYVWLNGKTGAIRPYRDFPPDPAFELVEKTTIGR